jgi:predicted transcriptional regulator
MSDGVWQSVSEIAAQRGVSKQAVSKRLKALAGRVATRQDGPRLLVNRAEFDRIVGAETDPAQALRNRNQVAGGTAVGGVEAPRPQGDLAAKVYSQQRAKRESYEAEMARLELEEKQGRLLPVADVEAAMVRCAEALLREIEQLPASSDDPAIRVILKDRARRLRETLSREMRLLANDDAGDAQGEAA